MPKLNVQFSLLQSSQAGRYDMKSQGTTNLFPMPRSAGEVLKPQSDRLKDPIEVFGLGPLKGEA